MPPVVSVTLDPTLQNADAEEFQASLSNRIIGQPEAIKIVTDLVQSYMAGLNDPSPTIANVLFLGPTGTGKTGSLRPLPTKRPSRACGRGHPSVSYCLPITESPGPCLGLSGRGG